MSTPHYYHKVVVITGGSSGIGLALAKEFAKQGAHIMLIARDQERLEAAKDELMAIVKESADVDVFAADVSVEEEITTAIKVIGERYQKIHVLINCAGIAACGRFMDLKPDAINNCLQVNYMGAVYATHSAWRYLKLAKGQLSFVSSVAGYIGLIGYSAYAPTKFAMTGLAECLFYEGKDDDIRVSIIYPPDTETPLLQYEKANTLPECKALSKNIKVKTAEAVAATYMKGLMSNRVHIYCDMESRLVRWFKNNFPGLTIYFTNSIIRKSRKARAKN
jgi:3-dehydrosphinganine reductase